MNSTIFLGLVNNAALLLALGLLYDLLPPKRGSNGRRIAQIFTGFALGATAIAVMLTPWTMQPGLVFDTRSVLLAIAGLFFGTLPTIVAMFMAAGLRLYQGGSGAGMGVAVILSSGVIGILWRYYRLHRRSMISGRELYLFGIVVHLVMLLCAFLLPWPMPLEVLPRIAPAVLLIYPAGVLLLGMLLAHRQARQQATEAVRQSEVRYRTTLLSIGDAVIAVDSSGRVEVLNPPAETLTGWDADQARGRPLQEVLHLVDEHSRQPVDLEHGILQSRLTPAGGAIQVVLIARDGVEYPIQASSAPILSEEGARIGEVLVLRDQTHERVMMGELQDREEKYRLISENAGDVIWILDLASQKFTYVSPSVEKLRGYTVGEVLEQSMPEVMTPESFEMIRADLPARLSAFEQGDDRMRVLVSRVDQYRRDGTIVPTEVVTTLLRNAQGQAHAVLGVSRDISERIRAEATLRASEARLRESEERWQFALEGSGDGVWDWNIETGQKFYSRQWKAMLGFEDDEIGDGSVNEWEAHVHPDDLTQANQVFERYLRGELPVYVTEFRMRCKNGKYKWVLGRGRVVKRKPDGQPLRVIGTHTDITERKQVEDERKATIDLLQLINNTEDYHELMKTLLVYLRNWSGCEAVGIRLRDGEDFPYYETRGFPKSFLLLENSLCTYDSHGNLRREANGDPVLECMCGNILRGRFNPEKPFFSKHGSFWTNSTTQLLQSTTDTDRQARTRNRCNGEGYESVALIPLRSGKETLGLIQLNDKEAGRFSAEMIALFERLASNIANFLAKKRMEEELRASEERFSKVFRASPVGISINHLESGRYTDVNSAFLQVFGYHRDEVIGFTPLELCLWSNHEEWIQMVELLRDQGEIKNVEMQVRRTNGSEGEALVSSELIEVGGQHYILSMINDISDRKSAEQQIRNSLREKEVLLRELYHRTKNNMQVIRSMLVLQSSGSKSMEVLQLVQEMDNKIQAMALVHQMLYQSHSLDSINLHTYLQDLSQLILDSYGVSVADVSLHLDLESMFVIIDIATPVGLILNELLSNACKHAFYPGEQGEIFVSLSRTREGLVHLVFRDTGRGVPEGFDLRGQQTYGLTSMFSLAEHQLGGQVRTGPGPDGRGLMIDIQFPDVQYQPRAARAAG